MHRLRAASPSLLLVLLAFVAHLPALTPWFRFDPLFVVSGVTGGTWTTNGWLPGYPGWIDGNAGVTTEALGHFAAWQWLSLHVPWWNPYSGVGLPLVAEGQSTAMFLPFGLLLALPHGLLLLRIVLCALAGLFTHALLRRLGLRPLPCLLGAVCFELNGTFAWFAHGPIMPVAFLPLLLLGLEQARAGGVPAAAILGTAWSFLAGFPETAAIDLAFAAVWAGLRCAQSDRPPAYGLRAGGAVAVGLAIAAPAIWPFLEALPREFLGWHAGTIGGGWRRGNLALMLFPYSTGNLMADVAEGAAHEWLWFRAGGFVSIVPAALACAGLQRGRGGFALRLTLAGWIALTAARAAGFGPAVALFGLVPFLRQANIHLYAMPTWSLAASVLLALTVQDWSEGRRPAWRSAAVVLGPFAALGLWWSAASIAAQPVGLALGAVALPLALIAAVVRLTRDAATRRRQVLLGVVVGAHALALFMLPLFAGTHGRRIDAPAIGYLQTHAGLGRVVSFGPLVPNYGAMFGIAELNHNYLPVPQSWVDAIRAGPQPGSDGINFHFGSMPPAAEVPAILAAGQRLGAAYVLTWAGESLPAMADGPVLAYQDALMRLYALPAPAPYLAAAGCEVRGDRRSVAAECARPSTLVRRELAWPGWSATVNGRAAPVGSDGIFQSVSLPPGHSDIGFRYAPPGIKWALLGSALGLMALGLAAFPRGLRRLSAPPEAASRGPVGAGGAAT